MIKKIALALVLFLVVTATGCSADTFTVDSKSDRFKLRNVSLITLSGPDNSGENEEGLKVELTADGSTDYTQLVQLIQGKKTDSCDTNDFGLCYISFTFTSGAVTKVYPANDGSNYLCLYSLNEQLAQYIELSEEAMDQVVAIMEKYKITVIY